MINVIVITDSDIVQLGLTQILAKAPDTQLIHVANCLDAYEDIELTQLPNVAVIDKHSSSLPKAQALRKFIGSIKQRFDDVHFLCMTDATNKARYEFAHQLGVTGFCLRSISESEFVEAIRTVARGEMYIHDAYAEHVAHSNLQLGILEKRLTKRHMQVLELMLLGLSNGEIAELLYVSVPTVKSSIKSILRVLNARDRTEAISQLYQGMLDTIDRQHISYR